MTATQHDSRYSWSRLAISLAVSVVGSIGMWASIVVLPTMEAEFGGSRASAALPYTVMMIGFAVGNFTLGRAVDRFGITPVLSWSAVSLVLGFGGAAVLSSVPLITACHFFLGVGAAASFAPLISDVSQWFLKHRGIAVAIAACGNYLAGAVWPPVISYISIDYGWRGAYMFLAAACLVVVYPGAQLLRRQIDEASTNRATDLAASNAVSVGLSPQKLQVLLAMAGVGCCVAMSMPQVHIVALCIDRGFSAQSGALMLSLMLSGGVASRLFFGALSDRIGGLMVLFISGSLQMLALCLFLIQGSLASLFLISLIFGLSQGGIVPSYAIIVREYMPPQEAGKRVGIVIGSTIIGMALGGWMSGWLYDLTGSYAAAIWNGVAFNLLNIGIALALLVRVGPKRSDPALA